MMFDLCQLKLNIPAYIFLCLQIVNSVSITAGIKCSLPMKDTNNWLVSGTYLPSTAYFCNKLGYGRCYHAPKKPEKFRDKITINKDGLHQAIDKDAAFIIDVRTVEEVTEGHINSKRWINIPFDDIEDALMLPENEFRKQYKSIKPNVDDRIIFHCLSGVRSDIALTTAIRLGFNKAKHYPGGWQEWTEDCRS